MMRDVCPRRHPSQRQHTLRRGVTGCCDAGRPHRDPHIGDKWYVSHEEWPNSHYPPWAHGPGALAPLNPTHRIHGVDAGMQAWRCICIHCDAMHLFACPGSCQADADPEAGSILASVNVQA